MPYALGLSLDDGLVGWIGLQLLASASILAALGWKEIRTTWSWVAFGACSILAAGALVAAYTTGSSRSDTDLAASYAVAIGVGPALLGLSGGIVLAREHLFASTGLMLLGGALCLFGTWMALENSRHVQVALPLLLLGFGLTMAGPVLLTFRPSLAEARGDSDEAPGGAAASGAAALTHRAPTKGEKGASRASLIVYASIVTIGGLVVLYAMWATI